MRNASFATVEHYTVSETGRSIPSMGCILHILKDAMRTDSYRELKDMSFDREARRAMVNQPKD